MDQDIDIHIRKNSVQGCIDQAWELAGEFQEASSEVCIWHQGFESFIQLVLASPKLKQCGLLSYFWDFYSTNKIHMHDLFFYPARKKKAQIIIDHIHPVTYAYELNLQQLANYYIKFIQHMIEFKCVFIDDEEGKFDLLPFGLVSDRISGLWQEYDVFIRKTTSPLWATTTALSTTATRPELVDSYICDTSSPEPLNFKDMFF